ncbi:hypothetical protein F1C10_09145 [Sphingomonas sp. NBWT7]|uniref:heparin lyase I family protein n=1 Tax=Sphingomonas sp. NBWT7 TaxID=2596913 RepID=UPI0016277E2F|nr:heparin lyase I family protein [Sphingomonas sp. NBWT7]QNE32087.1 hypothetical protein F1C10_09145 [Sphingomonas sp. NBWT7]
MTRARLLLAPPVLLTAALALATGPAVERGGDDFERGLRFDRRPWALAQQVNGSVRLAAAPDRAGRALLAAAGPKRGSTVAKADLVARVALMPPGTRLEIAFDFRAPATTPLDSLQLVDVECATCGEGGNPGIRLYLRRGRLRVDRSKIGIRHAWTRDDAPTLRPDRWHRITWQLLLAPDDRGATRVLLDGREVLAARGATLDALPRLGADRIQIGITANSNSVPASAWFDNIAAAIRR